MDIKNLIDGDGISMKQYVMWMFLGDKRFISDIKDTRPAPMPWNKLGVN